MAARIPCTPFGKKMKIAMVEQDIPQQELARRLGIANSTVRKDERTDSPKPGHQELLSPVKTIPRCAATINQAYSGGFFGKKCIISHN